jgi:hypothetical protein
MPKPKEYGSPLGTPDPSSDAGRPKAKDPDIRQVREAMKKATTRVAAPPAATKVVRGSSANTPRKLRPPPILDAEIDKQSR